MGNNSKGNKNFILPIVVIVVVAIMGFFLLNSMGNAPNSVKYYEIIKYYQDGRVTESTLDLSSGQLQYKLEGESGNKPHTYKVANVALFMETINNIVLTGNPTGATTPKDYAGADGVSGASTAESSATESSATESSAAGSEAESSAVAESSAAAEDGTASENSDKNASVIDYIPGSDNSWMFTMLPSLLAIVLLIGLFIFMMRSAGGGAGKMGQFGKANLKNAAEKGRKSTFNDVAGAEEEKEELAEIVEFLRDPRKFNEIGARIPKGVLLVGPPGTGKTLLARAVAGEANVPFFSMSGSDFVEMYVGVGASRVRDLFEQAKKNAPSIVFIDEIDAVGRQRGAGLGGGHDEREQTLNQLLVEMDGFGANEGVIVIAATNRRDILDPALLRSGRFDRQVIVGYPDVKGREAILKVHSRNKPLGFDVDLSVIAKSTVGFTGADLESLMNEAALLAARKGHKAITSVDIEEATIKVIAGPEKKSRIISDKEKKLTAYHEAGHAVATYYCPTQDPVHQISIIPRGMAGGYTMSLPEQDSSYVLKTKMQEDLVVLLGGRVAESLVLDDISTGASNDIERATDTARNMVTRYGFTEDLGPIVYGAGEHEVFLGRDLNSTRNYSETVATEIDREIRKIIDAAYDRCKSILNEHMDQLHLVAQYLIRKEKVDSAGFMRMMTGEFTMADIEKMDAEAAAQEEA